MVTLIRGGIVLPVSAPGTAFDPGSVLIDGDTIVSVGPVEAIEPEGPPGRKSSTPPGAPLSPAYTTATSTRDFSDLGRRRPGRQSTTPCARRPADDRHTGGP
jgi:hypothetical protein